MRLRLLFTAVAVTATALTLTPVPAAQATHVGPEHHADGHNACDGFKTDITGTDKAEKFTLTPEKRIINAHGGNDVIETSDQLPLELPATVCMGSGDDILRAAGDGAEAAPVRYLDGGSGFDRAEIYICFVGGENGPRWTLRNVERITIVNCED